MKVSAIFGVGKFMMMLPCKTGGQDGRQNAQKPAAGQSDEAATHPAGVRFLDLAQYARHNPWHDAWAELQFGATTRAVQRYRTRLWGFYG
jgi:hypothetical protein